MTDTQRPWDRRTTERDPAYEAFAASLDTGSLRDAYRQRSGNEKVTPSHRRDRPSASRLAAIRAQRQRLREHLIQPRVLDRHQVRALPLRLTPKILQLRIHVVPGRTCRHLRELLQSPLEANTVRVGIRVGPVLGQLLRNHPVDHASQPILHGIASSHREALGFAIRPLDRLRPGRPLARR